MTGQTHFKHQRISAYVLLILLAILLFCSKCMILQGITLIVALYHAFLGVVMVIEDYIRVGQRGCIAATGGITVVLVILIVWRVLQAMC